MAQVQLHILQPNAPSFFDSLHSAVIPEDDPYVKLPTTTYSKTLYVFFYCKTMLTHEESPSISSQMSAVQIPPTVEETSLSLNPLNLNVFLMEYLSTPIFRGLQ